MAGNYPSYEAQIPHRVRPNQIFEVDMGGGNNRIQVRCPADMQGGDMFTIKPYTVQVPAGLGRDRVFQAVVNNNTIPVRAPPDCNTGDSMLIYAPVWDTHRTSRTQTQPRPPPRPPPNAASSQAAPSPSSEPVRRNSVKAKSSQWKEYLEKLQEQASDLDIDIDSEEIDPDEIPNEYICPITQDIMLNPVICVDGHSYEKEAIAKWFLKNSTSPKTNAPIPEDQKGTLIPNMTLRTQILEYVESKTRKK